MPEVSRETPSSVDGDAHGASCIDPEPRHPLEPRSGRPSARGFERRRVRARPPTSPERVGVSPGCPSPRRRAGSLPRFGADVIGPRGGDGSRRPAAGGRSRWKAASIRRFAYQAPIHAKSTHRQDEGQHDHQRDLEHHAEDARGHGQETAGSAGTQPCHHPTSVGAERGRRPREPLDPGMCSDTEPSWTDGEWLVPFA